MNGHQEALFWTFMGFFVVIGILSLLAVIGLVKVDPGFRKWAITVFFAGVTGAVIGLFNLSFPGEAPNGVIIVSLIPPQNVNAKDLTLVGGEYTYDEPFGEKEVKTHSGKIEVTWGNDVWQAKLPQQVLDKPVKLSFKDQEGNGWEVHPFYPNQNKREFFKGAAKGAVAPSSQWPIMPSSALAATSAETSSGQFFRTSGDRTTTVKFNNYARGIGEIHGRQYYQWRIFVDEPAVQLKSIEEVQYVLHRTFNEPFQISRDAAKQFELVTSGWGEFTILITIVYRDGSQEKVSYYLDFHKPWPSSP